MRPGSLAPGRSPARALAPGLRREDARLYSMRKTWASDRRRARRAMGGDRPGSRPAVSASAGSRPAARAAWHHAPHHVQVVDHLLRLQPLEHPHGRPLGHHRRGVVGVRGVGREHELRHHQPAGDGPQLGLQHGHEACRRRRRPPGSRTPGAAVGVENRARRVAAEVRRPARCAGWSTLASAWPATNCCDARCGVPLRCLRMSAIADWISATTLMFRSSFSRAGSCAPDIQSNWVREGL